jgi:carbon monoxide dehydrogenase subunit G
MQLKGAHTFQAPRQMVWEALMDPAVLAQALPGGEQLKRLGENEYKAVMNVRVGPVQGKFEGKIELSNITPLDQYHMKVSGSGPAGFVNGAGGLVLTEEGSNTLLQYEGDVQVGGKIAGVGQRLIDSTAKSIIKQGFKVLDEQIQARLAPPAPAAKTDSPAAPAPMDSPAATPPRPEMRPQATPTTQPTPPPTSGPSATRLALDVARDVARDLASDYIPPSQQDKVFYAALGALGMLLFVILVRLVQRD